MAPDSRATELAKEIAWDAIAPAYHEGAAEAAEDAIRELDRVYDDPDAIVEWVPDVWI